MTCMFGGRRSALDMSMFIFRGRRSTLDAWFCVFFANHIGRDNADCVAGVEHRESVLFCVVGVAFSEDPLWTAILHGRRSIWATFVIAICRFLQWHGCAGCDVATCPSRLGPHFPLIHWNHSTPLSTFHTSDSKLHTALRSWHSTSVFHTLQSTV